MTITNREALLTYIEKGNSVEYLFFWGHQKPKEGVSKSCFSQWFESYFSHDGIYYPTAEHFMMAEKARLFKDDKTLKKILAAKKPGEAKKLGREIKDFDDDLWQTNRFEIVVKANYLKFKQNTDLKDFLLKTGSRVLVEASPVDPIWGIGMAADNPMVGNPESWKGLNLLGFALMSVRNSLR